MIEIQNVSLSFGQKKILENISLQCSKGELICVLGRNGTGKSSLLQCISGFLKFEGTIKIFQKNIQELSAKEISRTISIVLPNTPVSAYALNVYETILLGRIPHLNWLAQIQEKDTQAVQEAIQKTQVQALLSKNLQNLSDGERQRVMIARAIAQDTPILIADEPTAFLDVYFRKQILQLFQRVAQEERKCVLLSTHEISLALEYADKLLLLNNEKKYLFLSEWRAEQVWEFLEG